MFIFLFLFFTCLLVNFSREEGARVRPNRLSGPSSDPISRIHQAVRLNILLLPLLPWCILLLLSILLCLHDTRFSRNSLCLGKQDALLFSRNVCRVFSRLSLHPLTDALVLTTRRVLPPPIPPSLLLVRRHMHDPLPTPSRCTARQTNRACLGVPPEIMVWPA